MKAQRPFNFDEAVISQMENIRRIGLRRLHNRSEIDDFVQETILRAYAKRDQLRDETKFDRWIAVIARNLALDWNSALCRRGREEPIDELPDIPDERTPHDILEQKEERRELHQAMGRLNEDDREMLRARYFEDASYEELQEKYGLSYSAVGFRLHRAKARLRKILTSTAAAFIAAFAGFRRAAFAVGGVILMTKSTKIAVVIAAALIAGLLGVALSLKHAHDPPLLDDRERMETSGASELDETGQSPRIVKPTASTPEKSKQEAPTSTEPLQANEKLASNATEGTTQEMTENDYSEHDRTDMANIGVLPLITVKEVTYKPSDEDRQRREAIQKALLKMHALGHVSAAPRDGYAPWKSENGDETLFIAEDVFPAYDALKKEDKEIESRSTSTITDRFDTGRIIWLEDGTVLEYYRRRSDGFLMRQATLTNGDVKRWVAGPPPDLSGYTESRIRKMQDAWRDE